MGKTEQQKFWEGNFGNEYTDRNPQTSEQVDELHLQNFNITKTELNNEFIGHLPKDIKILEVGTNTGSQLLLLQKLGFTDLTGIEISDYAIDKAKNNKKINFLKATAQDIPFKDNFFDLVFTAGVLIHIHPNDISKAIDEIYRVSKKYIFGFEYFSEDLKDIDYRGNKNFLWKNNFMKLFLQRHPDLKIVKEKKLKYITNDNQDQIFLLEKQS